MKKEFIIVLVVIAVIVVVIIVSNKEQTVGGDVDEHGCMLMGGYSWDVGIGACARNWELDESQTQAAKIAAEEIGSQYGLTILGVDKLECDGCFIIYLSDSDAYYTVDLEDWEVIEYQDFEGSFPSGLWERYHIDGYADAEWDDWDCWCGSSSNESAGCADAGSDGIGCGDIYPNNMNSWMVYGSFSLADYGISDADFSFEFKLACEEDYDQFFVGASIDGSNYYGVSWDGFHEEIYDFDLTDVYQLGNLIGEPEVWIAFVFQSDGSYGEIEGAQVDDVTIWKNISTGPTDPYEPNNTFSEAQQMNLEFDIDDALINPILDVDFFKLPISDLGILTITLSGLPADYDLYFYDPNQSQIAYSNNGSTSSEQIIFSDFGMTGYYYIKILGYDGAFNSFETYHLYTQWESLVQPDIEINPTSLTIIQDSKNALINSGFIEQQTYDSSFDGANYFGLGCKIKQEDIEYWKNHDMPDYPADPLITSIDWSTNDSPVKNQGTCGSCWAFAATAYIENLGVQNDLSEQVVLSCVTTGDCEGGYFSDALLYFKNTGVPEENCYPYIEDNGNCNDKCDDPILLERITTVSNQLWGSSTTVSNIKSKLNEGPLVVRMLVPTDNTFNGIPGYQGGIYNYEGSTIPNTQGHAVLLVGYDDDQQCFKAKNSWGTGWGEDGYFRISFDDVTDDVQFGTYARNGSGVYTEWQNGWDSFTISNVGDGILSISSIFDNVGWLSTSNFPSTP
nr:hypothetical protein [Bacteroidota bacterium]